MRSITLESTAARPGGRRRAGGAGWAGRLALVVAPFAVLLLAEAVMRVVDPAPEDPRWKDPYVRPLQTAAGEFVRDERGRILLSNEPTAAQWAGENVGRRAFAAERDDGVLRIFSIGASTTFGLKYAPRASYSRFLEARLEECSDGREVEVVNLGISGYDSVDLRELSEELLEYEPDVLIVYAGHNELKYPNLARVLDPTATALAAWARGSALLWRWLQDAPSPEVPPELTSAPLLDDEHFERALTAYSDALRSIVERARADGVEVLLCTPASNVRDKLPRQSVLPESGGEELRVRLESLKARLHPEHDLPSELPAEASELEELLDEASALCAAAPEASLAHFLLARVWTARGDLPAAQRAFERSRQLDRLPERAWPQLVESVRRIAEETGATLVDVEARLRAEAPGGVPGFELFFDYCHPNLRGHWIIADELLAALAGDPRWGIEPRPSATDFEGWCARFGVDESMGTLQRAREHLGTAAARDGDERARLLAVVEEFLAAVLKDPASKAEALAEAWTLRSIVAVMRGDGPACREALREAGAADPAVRGELMRLMARNAFFLERFEALGLIVQADGSVEVDAP